MDSCGKCAVCNEKASQKCANCQSVFYCCRDHQKQHWKTHKQQCSPVKLSEDTNLGRFLEATRNIKQGDVVIRESPLITGPAQVTPPICLGCYKLLEEKTSVPCTKCGWPMCSELCSTSENHVPECYYTVLRGEKVTINAFGIAHPNYQSIAVLRCLYQRDNNSKLWKKLQQLESHCDARKGTDKWKTDQMMVAEFIVKFFKLDAFTEDEIMKCCGIVQVNAHEVPLLEPGYIALYERASMMEHSCRANCGKSFSSSGDIIVSAGIPIPSGEHLSVCYTDPLWGTEARRYHLAESKFFECTCVRCQDPTELATMYSAVKCQRKPCKGYLLPQTFIEPLLHTLKSNEEENFVSDKLWNCNECKDQVKDDTVQQLLQAIGREITAIPQGDPDSCEKFIGHCSKYLHPNHYYITDVSLALAQMIGQPHKTGLVEENDERLLLKAQLCRKLADLMETLVPAESRVRGTVLFELHAAMAETSRRKTVTEGPYSLLNCITEARKVLTESALLLKHEPDELPEGKIARQARVNLVEMDQLIVVLSARFPAPM